MVGSDLCFANKYGTQGKKVMFYQADSFPSPFHIFFHNFTGSINFYVYNMEDNQGILPTEYSCRVIPLPMCPD